jgi:DNA-binding MarR family transcriptional regulator
MPTNTTTKSDIALTASELRVVLGQLVRRLRAEHRFPLLQGAVLGRLDREGPRSIGDLAAAEKVRPRSMAQTVAELEAAGLVRRRPYPDDRRRVLVEETEERLAALEEDRRHRVGWLVSAIERLSPEGQDVLAQATAILRRLAEV